MELLQRQVQHVADRLVESGAERGLQIAVYRHGQQLVDVAAGIADVATGRPVTSDTLFHVTSTGKGLTSTVVHLLVEDGTLTYDTPIAALWPEFAANGKEGATVRHALTHSIGVPALPVNTTPQDLRDWMRMCAIIADAKPWWDPGTRTGYHPQTFGFIVGEVVRRATGQPISRVMRERVAEPLGVADELFFGLPSAALARTAPLEETEGSLELTPDVHATLAEQVPFFRIVDGWTPAPPAVLPNAAFCNRTDVLTADIPAGGVMSARAIARVYAALMSDLDGVRLVPAHRLAEIITVEATGIDEVTGAHVTRGLGFEIGFTGPLDSPAFFGVAGSGGTAAYADATTGLAIAVTKNRVTAGDYTTFEQISAVVAKALAPR